MPRYTLFGPTVTHAARMEQTGIAQRIHVSKACRDLLTKLGGFDLQKRDSEDFVSTTDDSTYWLLGRIGSKFKADGVLRS
ncbi:hypothetical protein RvY_07446 [Ramazzottius varieornatus]|uniref:Guanylate cyclase domain-containing protein n=1 Tax=Ramazzottius varieornatus TaxID=947166 RepID=A0A1D1VAN8_RAMVA|nr:hypothetical protein RvY_07446 [Ramazzottius varieornatus]